MKLLIVDDDYQIREGLLAAMDWEGMGIAEEKKIAAGAFNTPNLKALQAILEAAVFFIQKGRSNE